MDVMGIPGGQRSARVVPEGQGERQGCPRGSTRTLGVSGGQRGRQGGPRWVRGVVKVSQEVKTSVRGVPGVEGGLRDPRVVRWTSWVYQGVQGAPGLSQRVKGNARGVQGGQQGR